MVMAAVFREKENVPDAAVFGLRGFVSRAPEERCFGLKNTVSFLTLEVTAEIPQYKGQPKPQAYPVDVFNRELCAYLRRHEVTLGAEITVSGELTARACTSAKGTPYTVLGLRATQLVLHPAAARAAVEF